MRHLTLLLSISFFSLHADAQYYYKDIISNKNLQADMIRYKQDKVKKIRINSIEANGEKSEGFFCEKKFSRDFKKTELFTKVPMTSASLLTSYFNQDGLLLSSVDSSDIVVNETTYTYDQQGRITHIISQARSSDDDFITELKEEHIYNYEDSKVPVSMTRVKNGTDSILILFTADENNNLAIEKDTRTGGKYYYYYDNKNRLTDVVHMNEYKQKMIPDYQFEYNAAGNLVQMISTEEGNSEYYTWKYTYENGLRTKEKVYGKNRKLLGSVDYEYIK